MLIDQDSDAPPYVRRRRRGAHPNRMLIAAVLLFVPSYSWASAMGVDCDARLLNETTVVGVNSAYESALRASDTDALQRVLAPDFLFVTSSGEVRDRQEILRSYGAKEVNLKVFESENVRVRFYGSVGILTADITKEGDYLTGPRAGAVFSGRYRFTRVYACGPRGWQLVSTHESELTSDLDVGGSL